jgi:dehydrogenase/reductase SDR family member 7B
VKLETQNHKSPNTFPSRNVWITGASSGIGEALALQLAAPGTTLILSGLGKELLEPVATKCELKGSTAHIVPFNLTKEDEISQAAIAVQSLVPKIDILANVGGIGQRSLIIETPADVARKIMETDFWGHATLTGKILPYMVKTGGGTIVVMSSLSGLFGFPQRSLYCAAKHALHGFFETLRLEHHKDKINVLMVCPGRVKTNFSYGALTSTGDTHGKMDKGQENGVSVEYCAAKIDRAIRKNKKQILVGRKELIMAYLKRYAPWLFYRIALRIDPNS